MRESYDFSEYVNNPYAKRLKKQITFGIDEKTISYFKRMAEDKGIPQLINTLCGNILFQVGLNQCLVFTKEMIGH